MNIGWNLNNHFIKFALLLVLIVALGGATGLALAFAGYRSPDPDSPLGAPAAFIVYNNLLKASLAMLTLFVYQHYIRHFKIVQLHIAIEYIFLAFLLFILNGIMQFTIAAFISNANPSIILWTPGLSILFRLNIVVAGMVVYRWTLSFEKNKIADMNSKLELATLRELKTRAELDALQAKVNPHFLYNSLNSIYSLIDTKPAVAKEMVQLLSKLFRLSINTQNRMFWTIREELELIETYLSIEKVRFGDKLLIHMDADSNASDFIIPRFLVQPMVENAIKHGTSHVEGTGVITIVIKEINRRVMIKVSDNGPTFSPDFQMGYGLRSIHDKLKLCSGESEIEISSGSDKFVVLNLPNP